MTKLNAIDCSKYINNKYKKYLRSSFQLENNALQQLFEDALEKEKLFKGPYLDLSLPFRRGKTIRELVSEGVLSQKFLELSNINFDRPLYAHQEESIRKINCGRGAIVTTGTGSGKTESFLYPILNEILREIENGETSKGIRALMLYPMNALINDQIERIRAILSNYPAIKFGFFTGETQEKISKNERAKRATETGIYIPENELLSREEIRENPPHLLFTNNSMLEYLLIRPNDYALFAPENLKNWKFVVLDEAHTYNGSRGIEISLLMKRLTGLAINKPRFILTSATLGQKGKSELQIVNFANNLTSSNFIVDDIIFSTRIGLDDKIVSYRISGEDYIQIKNNIKSKEQVCSICNKYLCIDEKNINEMLYELLIRDSNVNFLFQILKDEQQDISYVCDKLNDYLTNEQLLSLIELINMAEKNGIGIFDLKYHSFVRPLSGAFVTCGKNQTLSLMKTNMIDGKKAFEIGNCRFCGTPYIIGRCVKNNVTNLMYLYQNKEVDIYENYGNNDAPKVDYFLMKNISDEYLDEADKPKTIHHKLCSKCGAIHVAENVNAKKCTCGEEFYVSVYLVNDVKDTSQMAFNNISACPCCGHKSHSGIVKSFDLGKDEGSALIAQILYEAIDDNEEENSVSKKKLSLKLLSEKEKQNNSEKQKKEKQFLAFSDSRQEASFAAAFFSANYIRMLQKRIIWQVIEDEKYSDVPFELLVSYLERLIKRYNLFDNTLSPMKNAWITALSELLKIDGAYDAENLGLYYFDLDITDILEQIDDEAVEEAFGKYNINKNDLATMIQIVFALFKTVPAIDYTKSTLTPEEKKEFLEYRRFDNSVTLQSAKSMSSVKSFLPANRKENIIVRYVKKACNCSADEAIEILQILFQLAEDSGLMKNHTTNLYRIDANKYVLKNYRKQRYYQCTHCGRLTPHNIHNVCVHDQCEGVLVEVDPDEVLANNYYREEYKHKKIERIVVKEHTAQLEKNTGRMYQNDFKNKNINILSCSTTFEMGIDIGDLETVFMRNVPPTPANYVQRAGRAGRRKESVAYILTYCTAKSHDYTYFNEPRKMIAGIIDPPYFDVVNKKIIIRHLMACCLGFFFRKYPEYSKEIDYMVFGDGYEKFNNYISSKPEDLNHYINECVLAEKKYLNFHDFKWFAEMGGKDEKLELMVKKIREIDIEYQEAKKEATIEEKFVEADFFNKQIIHLHQTKVIDALSKYSVIPKYGFPIDVVELEVYENGNLNNNLNLDRDLRIALSEYAPDSEVFADKRKYVSKYISLPKIGSMPEYYFCECPKCQKINVFATMTKATECKYCGESIANEPVKKFIEPIYGFKTGVLKESSRLKPKKSFSGEIIYLGGGKKEEFVVNINDHLFIETSSDDELMVMNRSDFYICPVCGYSKIATKAMHLPIVTEAHKNHRQYSCKNEEMYRRKLGHRFRTDVARITSSRFEVFEKKQILSFMYALLEGISRALEIDRNDIDGVLEYNVEKNCFNVLIYDNVPGGAGHVKRLLSQKAILKSLQEAYNKVSQDCCEENTSCYNCLRNYYNQMYHTKLQRGYAKAVITDLQTYIQ